MSKVRLYGTFTEVRAGAKANSDRGVQYELSTVAGLCDDPHTQCVKIAAVWRALPCEELLPPGQPVRGAPPTHAPRAVRRDELEVMVRAHLIAEEA